MSIETHKFCVDTKCTIWDRTTYRIQAETYKEALEIAKKLMNHEISEDSYYIDNEDLYDTREMMEPEDNDGLATRELIHIWSGNEGRDQETTIFDNGSNYNELTETPVEQV